MNTYYYEPIEIDGFECSMDFVIKTCPSVILHEDGDEFSLELDRQFRKEVIDGKMHITFTDFGDGSECEYVVDEDPEMVENLITKLYKFGQKRGSLVKKLIREFGSCLDDKISKDDV